MSPSIFPSSWQIPIDYTLSKGYFGLTAGDLTVYDAYGNLAFRVYSRSFNSNPRRIKTLLDAAGNPLISAVHQDGGWQGFRGNSWEGKDLIFTVQKLLYSPFKTELEIFLAGENLEHPRPSFRLKGSPFQRSCTIYMGNSIVAQTNPMYSLGKVIYSRHKFRLTVYPGTDHALVIAMLIIFFGRN